jgi:60 kDa SS-A/Ro ribonucleoprotein
MSWTGLMGIHELTPMLAAAAMSTIHTRTEPCLIRAFATDLRDPKILQTDSLEEAMKKMIHVGGGGTDCSLPMIWAAKNNIEVDTFIVYTDNETWAHQKIPADALRDYRQQTGIPAKLIVAGMTATAFSIADPNDAGMLDVAGFDSAIPGIITDFSSSPMVFGQGLTV